jgi:hypothetical protein
MNRSKTFDCVKMKTELQENLRKAYDACTDRSLSYADFIREKTQLSSELQAFKDKVLKC